MDSDTQHGSTTTPGTAGLAPQIRSRITVVCAECKRLKLKCDRRNPCGSCQKRDTVSRCIYSPAAAEKVDLHSLNNRLIQVEATLAQLTSGQFMPSYPFSSPSSSNGPPPPSLSLNVTLSPPTIHHCSLAIPLEDIDSTWLNEIDLGFTLPTSFSASPKNESTANVKVEPLSVEIPFSLSSDDFDMTDRPPSSSSSANHPASTASSPNLASLSLSSSNGLPPTSAYYSSSSDSTKPQLTPALLALLPSLNTYSSSSRQPQQHTLLSYLTHAEESTAYTYPCLNWKTLRERALELLINARPNASSPAANVRDKEMAREMEKEKERETKEREAAQARQLFMGSTRSRPIFGSGANADIDNARSHYRTELTEGQNGRPSTSVKTVGDIPLFAAICAAIALGALEAGRRMPQRSSKDSSASMEPAYWYSLSDQAIGIWETSVAVTPVSVPSSQESETEVRRMKEDQQHDMDYITTCLLQLAFLAKDGLGTGKREDGTKKDENNGSRDARHSPGLATVKTKAKSVKGVAAVMFPLVGKLVNYARQMSLNKDPEDACPPAFTVQSLESGHLNAASSTGGVPTGAKKARSNSKLSDPSLLESFSASKAARESQFTLYEAEIRRRIWWTIMYYDLFVSDIMNQPPLIADNSFNTKRPVANVDENVFGPSSIRIPPPVGGGEDGTGYSKDGMRYFEILSRLTLLVRSIKRRMNTPEFGHAQQVRTSYYGSSPNSNCYSIDQAASMEAEVRTWLTELPPYYQIDHGDSFDEVEPTLVAQRCEVAMTAHRLVLRVYLPFLKKHAAGVPHQASLGSINAAHGIMKAAKALSELWKSQSQDDTAISSALSPALFDFYPLARSIFDAAVVCAHAVIKQPSTMWAAAAMEDVDVALEIMKNLSESKFDSAVGATYVITSADCTRIVEALKSKAEGGNSSRRGSGSPNVPSKRKHHEVDSLTTPAYVYPIIPAPSAPTPSQGSTSTLATSYSTAVTSESTSPIAQTPKRQLPFPATPGVDAAKEDLAVNTAPKAGDKDKKQKKAYPAVGVRKRPAKDIAPSPTTQSSTTISASARAPSSRRQSVSTVSTASTPVTEKSRPMFQQSHPSPAAPQGPPFQSSPRPQLQTEQFAYRSRSSSLSQDPRLHAQAQRRNSTLSTSTDFTMGSYNTSEEPQQNLDMMPPSNSSPQSEMHIRASIPPRQHSLQTPYVESPPSYETPAEQPTQYDFQFGNQDGYSSGYGNASSSNGSSSPYPNMTSTAPTFGHQPSPPSFVAKANIHTSQPEEYYSNGTMMYDGFDNTASAAQPGMIHGDIQMMFDPITYDVKPSMEELSEQHRNQQAYQSYCDPRNPAVSSAQMWTALPQQQGHISNGTAYWEEANATSVDSQTYYHQT